MANKQFYWIDAHFCGLRSQTNIYGLSKITSQDGLSKLLAVSIDGHFVTVEYQKSFDNRLIPVTKEDVFFDSSSFPEAGDVEIVSVDVICNNMINNRIVLAYSYLKIESSYDEKTPNAYMNIYFLPERESTQVVYSNFMDAINQSNRQHLNIEFIPFKLTHHLTYGPNQEQIMCLIVSGNDNKIHVYTQSSDDLSFSEEKEASEKYFPEFSKIDGCVTQMEFYMMDDTHRMSVLGNQSGLVVLTLVDIITKEVKNVWSFEMDSPITSLLLFNQHTQESCPSFLESQEDAEPQEIEQQSDSVNLLVTSAIDSAIVFCDVGSCGLSKSYILPLSNTQDVILCSCVADIDFDGENEILIGTYGQVVLAYKFMHEKPVTSLMTSTPYQSPFPVPVGDNFNSSTGEDKSIVDQEKIDSRRRHKSMAAVFDNSDNIRFDEWNKTDESFHFDGGLKDAQMARLVRSQENLATPSPKSVLFNTPDQLSLTNNTYVDMNDFPGYRLIWTKRFSDPVMSLAVGDVMGDGMLDLVVLTLKGLHILQPDLNDIATLMLERLKFVCESESEADDDYHQLQMELLQDQQL
ncbi:hypothetical protein Btru_041373 [Bulinus truncatus]|nr:hypothetical protein Btru_041373 [Bulinus truncatus]